ncbi:MAG: hypothetical protein JSS27_11310 [Planctomycetes bacterium]|nr:hypothetical protein [Planctomycetota bacterium]
MPADLNSNENTALLRRILAAVEKEERKRWVDIASAVLLSLATMFSAWCAYQATLWGGVQTFRLADAAKAGRISTEATLSAMQFRSVDAAMLISYIEAQSRGDARTEQILAKRFRPEMRVALDAWLKTDPFNNPDAPLNPFKMAEYKQPEIEVVRQANENFQAEYDRAQTANQTSDRYVLLTVLFASVLFFAGMGSTFDSQRLQLSALVISLALFAVTSVAMFGMPICRE